MLNKLFPCLAVECKCYNNVYYNVHRRQRALRRGGRLWLGEYIPIRHLTSKYRYYRSSDNASTLRPGWTMEPPVGPAGVVKAPVE